MAESAQTPRTRGCDAEHSHVRRSPDDQPEWRPGRTIEKVSRRIEEPSGRPSVARSWLMASRPATLPASAAGVVVGLGAAYGAGAAFRPDTALECVAAALLLQIFANLANDLSDFRRGADTADRLGPTRAVAAGLISPAAMQTGMFVVALAAGFDGILLTVAGGPAILAVGLAAAAAALAYTGGPWPFGYKGLGELFVFVFFGPVCAGGTAYLQAGRLEPVHLTASIAPGAFAVAILVTNNLRDVDTDRAAGKRTLAVRFGRRFARAEYLTCLIVAWLTPAALALAGLVGSGSTPRIGPVVLLPFAAVPFAGPLVRAVLSDGDPRRLNGVLKGTGRLGLAFAVLFAAGLGAGVRPA
jgi:1,4-dihydroxy-2-naphthoate octaprenyltransferase